MGAVTPSFHPLAHDIVGFYFGAITVLYGITLGLLMIDVWPTFSETQDDVRKYTRHVLDVAWP